ncbi:unnamed protein product [Mytilus edulis]|uniref:Reverse transcriptase domain-containing protein n=1 Tax=Mytilus edulis TaxID=6550 RepID=A0A8S3SKV9_MYTED|nr:unnamed protein product [Mytilus edulis]
MPPKEPKRSNRKRKSTQRLGEVMENLGSSDVGLGVSIDNSAPSSSNPNIDSGQLSADNPNVQSNSTDPNTYNDDQIMRILTVATPIITQTVVTILKSTGVIQGREARYTTTCNTIEMTTPSQSHSTNIDKQSSESSHPSCSNVISRSGQQCFMPTEETPSQQVVNHLLQGNPNTGTFSNELGGQGLSRPLALGVEPKLKADIWSNKFINLEDLLKSKSRVVKYVPVEKDDCLTFVKNSSSKAKIESMAQWHEAFRIYGAIYFEKYPTESPKLMKYAAIIANLAEKAGIEAAFFYDQAYRQWREVDPLHLPWDGVNGELFNEALAMGLIGKTNAMKQPFLTQSLTAPARKQKRFCYAFNNESGCTARICRYEHTCQVCGGDHSRRDCQQSKHENADSNSTNRRGALIQKNSPVNRNLKPGDFQISTPIHIDQLGKYLKGYDTSAEKYQFSRNLKSTLENCLVLKKKITEEIKAGRVAGPFKEPPFENFRISPLGLVPKSKPGEFRVIHDLSHPLGSSVNDGISKENSAVQYQSVDDACQLMLKYGKNCIMSKIDVVQAYRLVPMHFSCYHLLGFALEEGLYFDKNLAMGLSYSCNLFERFSSAIHWIAETKLAIHSCVHLLDDFLFISPPPIEIGQFNLQKFLDFAAEIGLPIKSEKTVLPTTKLIFLGLELDSEKMEIRLPLDKLEKVRNLLGYFSNKKKHKFETSQSLHMYTDASNLGFGGFLGTHWFYHGWTDSWLKLHISIREFYPIVLAVELWSQILRNKHVQFHCDNIAVVHCINKQTAKDVQLMALVRRLVVQALKYNIFFEAKHIPGLKNILADKLSRFQVSDFKRLAPEMDQTPTDVSHLMKDL